MVIVITLRSTGRLGVRRGFRGRCSLDNNNKLTQLVGPGRTTTFGYDNNGNTTSMTQPGPVVTSYGYDYENRLASVTNPSYTAAYTYSPDALRPRVQESNNPNPDRWMQYDGVRPVLEGTLSGDTFTTVNKYVWEGDSYHDPLVYGLVGGSWRYYLYDGLGSTRQLMLHASPYTVTDTYQYEAFGNLTASTGTTPNLARSRPPVGGRDRHGGAAGPHLATYRYVGSLGYYQTGNDLMHLGARYYTPELGRFLSLDPTGSPSSLYCESSPSTCTDPTGLVGVNCPGQDFAEHQGIRWAVKAICTPMGQAIMRQCSGVDGYLAQWCASGTVRCGSRDCVKHPRWGGHDDPRHPTTVYLCVTKADKLRDDPLRVLIHELIHSWQISRGQEVSEERAYVCGPDCEKEFKKVGLY